MRKAILTGYLSMAVAAPIKQHPQYPVVNFPEVGRVSVHSVRMKGEVPYVELLASTGKHLLTIAPETDKFFAVDDVADATGSHIYFGTVKVDGLPGPMLLVITLYVFADDCGYTPALIGVRGGKLQTFTPKLKGFETRGGAYLQAAADGKPAHLLVVSERYQAGDVHANGPSKMAVFTYDFDQLTGKFVLVKQEEVPAESIETKGVNLVSMIPALSTC